MFRVILNFFFVLSICSSSFSQENEYFNSIEKHQDSLRAFYTNPETTILKKKEFKNFKGLDFYSIDSNFRVSAQFTRTPNEKPFLMETSAGIPREYVKYGEITFQLKGKSLQLAVYQNPLFTKTPNHEYADALMLGFTDYTSGDGSYGGGRYIDIGISQIIDGKLTVDFNKSYNPYCAYTSGYACAIPPEENDLKLRIEAGIKDYAGVEEH